MAKSSINIQASKDGSAGHNSREHFSHSVVFTDEQNECTSNLKDAYALLRSEVKKRSEKYTERTGQKLQKNTVTQLSAVINLEQHHTLKDLEPLKAELEAKFGTKVVQMAIHRDEGKLISKADNTELYSGKDFFLNRDDNKLYFDKAYTKLIPMDEYEIKKNYHAHIEMLGLDENGQAIRQKMNRIALQKLQTFTAQSLGMERGQERKRYTKEQMKEITTIVGKKSDYASTTLYAQKFNEVARDLGYFIQRTKRLDTHQFKDVGAEREANKRLEIAKQEDLKAKVAELRAELKENGAVRADYARLEQFSKELSEKVKSKDITIDELRNSVEYWRNGYKQESKASKVVEKIVEVEKIVKVEDTTKIKELEKKLSEALQSKKELEARVDMSKEEKSDFRPILAPKIAYKTVEVKTGMFGSEKQVVLSNVHAMQLESYAEALAEQNKSLKRQNTELKGQVEVLEEINGYQDAELKKLSHYKKAYNDLVIWLKAITKIDKVEEIINAIREKFSHTQEPKREEKPNTFQAIRAEADTHLKEQTATKKELSDKERVMQMADDIQREKEQNTQSVKTFVEEQKPKSKGFSRDR